MVTHDHKWISEHIPHQGSMCLLDTVEQWDQEHIVCRAVSHRLADNPLRVDGVLAMVNGIEYAAQAMAVHGALLATRDKVPNVGFLASAREVCWNSERLDEVKDDLLVWAKRISGNEVNILYEFSVHAGDLLLLTGRASVVLEVILS